MVVKVGIVSDPDGCANVWDTLINGYFKDVDYIYIPILEKKDTVKLETTNY